MTDDIQITLSWDDLQRVTFALGYVDSVYRAKEMDGQANKYRQTYDTITTQVVHE